MKRDNALGIFIVRLFTAVLFAVPGAYKLFFPGDFLGFLQEGFPALLLPALPFLFYFATAIELIGGIFILIGYKVRLVVIPLAAILFIALVTVVIPDAATSKIGLINILFHLFGIGILLSLLYLEPGKWAVDNRIQKNS